ncbi:2-dehydropantoate 2-reductase [Alteromonas aestuariivivens]|nr:2-dehydropantoate 2-reductase [Alteromonas aestuariivivens]
MSDTVNGPEANKASEFSKFVVEWYFDLIFGGCLATHCVFGCGLIGSYLGSILTANGQNVQFVARGIWAERLQAGFVVSDLAGRNLDFARYSIAVPNSGESNGYADVVWLTVKCTQLEQALIDVAPWIGPETEILCCQNGVGSDAAVRRAFAENCVRRVMVPFNVVFECPARLHKSTEGTLVLENLRGSDLTLKHRLAELQHPMLQVRAADDMTAVLWAKLQLNLGNSVNALSGLPVREMLQIRQYRWVIAAAMEELLEVCRAEGMQLPLVANIHGRFLPVLLRLPNFLFSRIARRMLDIDPSARTSMWWDLHNGRKTEVEYLHGAVIAEARRYSLPCPVNQALLEAVGEAEQQATHQSGYETWSAQELKDFVRQKQ